MGLLQGACQNPGAPEDEEWGLQNPLAGFWFGRFAVLPLRSFAPRAKLRSASEGYSFSCDHRLGTPRPPAIPHFFLADGWLGLEIAWPPQGCIPPGVGTQWEDLSVRVGLRRP